MRTVVQVIAAAGAAAVLLSAPASAGAPPDISATGARLIDTPTAQQIAAWSGASATRTLAVPSLRVVAPRSYRLGAGGGLTLALRASRPGAASLLVRSGRAAVARAHVHFRKSARTGVRITLSTTARAGAGTLRVSFRRRGRANAAVRSVSLTLREAVTPAPSPPVPQAATPTPVPQAATPAPTPTPTATPAPGRVVLYRDIFFEGDQRVITGSVSDLREYGFDDATSSIMVFGPIRATFYENRDFTGRRSTQRGAAAPPDQRCNDVAKPFAGLPGIWGGVTCNWEFGSPMEVGNDQISSIAITPDTRYDQSSRLVYPQGEWLWLGTDSWTSYRFFPDGTYVTTSNNPGGATITLSGGYRLGYHMLDPLHDPLPWWGGNYFVAGGLRTRYQYVNDRVIQILSPSGMWDSYTYNPNVSTP